MRLRTCEQGFTLLETVVVLAISGLLMTVVAATASMFILLPGARADELVAQEDLDFAAQWILEDGRKAEIFEVLPSPWYGRFTWYDYSISPPEKVRVAYKYQGGLVTRSEEHEQIVEKGRGVNWEREFSVARWIKTSSDASFSLSEGKVVTAQLTATVNRLGSLSPLSLTKTVRLPWEPCGKAW